MSGEVLGRGKFRVDRRRALEKMEKFQLEDPHRYVLELLAAAIASGATAIEVTNDSDDFVISWEPEELPSRDDLEALLDHLFGHPKDRREHVLQHLAVGVLGAHGLNPRWLRVDRGPTGAEPAVRLSVDDPTYTPTEPLRKELDGMRCHVRERLGQRTIAEALMLAIQDPVEARIVQGAAGWCPVPITINGRRMPVREPPPLALVRADVQIDHRKGVLWLVPPYVPTGVDLVRHGVIVGRVAIVLEKGRLPEPFGVIGWFSDDELRLNASRSAVVEDDIHARCWQALERAVERLLVAIPAALDGGDTTVVKWSTDAGATWSGTRKELLEAAAVGAIATLGIRRKALGALSACEVLADLEGNAWSGDELAALKLGPAITTEPSLVHDPKRPFFGAAWAPAVRAFVPDAPDLTDELRVAAQGRERRRRAESERADPFFPDEPRQRRFREGTLQGSVRLAALGGRPVLRVWLRVGGLPVEVLEDPFAGGTVDVILDDAAFTPDPGFHRVERDARFRAAMDVARREAREHLVELVLGNPGPATLPLFTALVGGEGELDARLLDAPAMRRGNGAAVSLREIRAAEQPWLLTDRLPTGCPASVASRVLVVPLELVPRWLRWLGAQARDGAGLAAEIERARRLAGPRVEAKLAPRPQVVVPVETERCTGEIGISPWTAQGWHSGARVTLLRAGVPVRDVVLPCDLDGVVGVLDVSDLEVNAAHDDVSHPKALEEVARRILGAVDRLAVAFWDTFGPAAPARPLPDPIVRWLQLRGRDRWPEDVLARPLFPTAGRGMLSLAEVEARIQQGKRGAKIPVLREPPPPGFDFDEALLLPQPLLELLKGWIPDRIRIADRDVAEARAAFQAYLARSAAPSVGACLARRDVEEPDAQLILALPADPDRAGKLVVEARWHDRVLATRLSTSEPGLLVVASGPAFAPDRTFTNVRDTKRLMSLKDRAGGLFDALLADALKVAEARLDPAHVPAWLAIRSRLSGRMTDKRRDLVARIEALPLLHAIDGQRCSLAEAFERRAAGKIVAVVSAELPVGPSDDAMNVQARPYAAGALEAVLGFAPADRTETLKDWRKGQAARARLHQQEPVLTAATLRKQAFSIGGARGEVGLLPPGEAEGLSVTILVDGLPLPPVTWGCPAPAVAIVAMEGLKADAGFQRAVEGAALGKARNAVDAALSLLAATLDDHTEGALLRWGWRWAAAGRASTLPLFPVLGGGRRLTWSEVVTRGEEDGGIGIVRKQGPALVAGRQPIVAADGLGEILAAHYPLFDLDRVALAHVHRQPPPSIPFEATAPVAPPFTGRLGFHPAHARVEVRRSGVLLGHVQGAGPVPLCGFVDAPGVRPDAAWRSLVEDDALARLREWLGARSRDLVGPLVTLQVTSPDPQRGAVLGKAIRALAAGPHEALASEDAVVRRLVDAPLFSDSVGSPGSLRDLCSDPPIRWVPPGTSGRPAPGRGRVWRLDPDALMWLRDDFELHNAEVELQDAEEGHRRRQGPRFAKTFPRAPRGAVVLDGTPADGKLFLVDPAGAGSLAICVGGVQVEARDPGVRGLQGWIDGDFPTDAAFRKARLEAGTQAALTRAVRRVLETEWREDPDSAVARMRATLAGRKRSEWPAALAPWAEVPAFADPSGAPVSLGRVVEEIASRGSVRLADQPGGPARKKLVLLRTPTAEALLAQLFPDAPAVTEEPRPDAKPRRSGRSRAGQLVAEWTDGPVRERALRALGADVRTPWLTEAGAAAEADPEGLAPVIAAWAAAEWAVSNQPSREAVFQLLDAVAGELIDRADLPLRRDVG